jgi:hypothetical protein
MCHDIVNITSVVKDMTLPNLGNVTLDLFFIFCFIVVQCSRVASNHCNKSASVLLVATYTAVDAMQLSNQSR